MGLQYFSFNISAFEGGCGSRCCPASDNAGNMNSIKIRFFINPSSSYNLLHNCVRGWLRLLAGPLIYPHIIHQHLLWPDCGVYTFLPAPVSADSNIQEKMHFVVEWPGFIARS